MKYTIALFALLGLASAAPAPQAPSCECEPVFCTQVFPESCYCQNDARRVCYEKCGGPDPIYDDCTVSESTEKRSVPAPYTRCGSRGMEPCLEGQVCVEDILPGECGMACDQPGYCVPEIPCGGFVGLECPAGLECKPDNRDDCDVHDGGADCMGLCYKLEL